MKGGLSGKFIVLSAFIEKTERVHTNKLISHLKVVEQNDTNIPKSNKKQEIFKIRAQINKLEKKRIIQIIK